VKTLYDIDDPIFSRQVYARNKNLDYLKAAEKNGLLDSSALFLSAMGRCEMLIGSTPHICDLMTRESGKAAYLWRNLIDSETLQAARQALSRPARASNALVIGYASGSRAHEADFRSIEAVLAEIMARHTNVELYILGYLELPPALEQYSARITRRNFTDSAGYMSDLAAVDINLVPLLNNEFNECKSAIRYMEAGLLGIPTVATAVGDFKHIVVHRETGLLAQEDADWREYIELLLGDVDFRTQLGENARQMVLSKLSTMDEQYLGQLNVNVVEAIHGNA
jgi:glycosyltransferase involved in cell wall biosynthesis